MMLASLLFYQDAKTVSHRHSSKGIPSLAVFASTPPTAIKPAETPVSKHTTGNTIPSLRVFSSTLAPKRKLANIPKLSLTFRRRPQKRGRTQPRHLNLFNKIQISREMQEFLPLFSEESQTQLMSHMNMVTATQVAENTLRKAVGPWERWRTFAEKLAVNPVPPRQSESLSVTRAREAAWDLFALTEYIRAETLWKQPNKDTTYSDVFHMINLVLKRIKFTTPMSTPRQRACVDAYSQKYARASKQAAPLYYAHVEILWAHAEKVDDEWVWVVTHVIVILWFTGCRWDCIQWLNIELTMQNFANANSAYYLFHLGRRKFMRELTTLPVPNRNGALIDPVKSMKFLVNRYNRRDSEKGIIPYCRKSGDMWVVDPDTDNSCPYHQFLPMHKMNSSNAGIGEAGQKLHAPRVGHATQLSQAATPLRMDILQKQMGHRCISSTRGYCHLSDEQRAAAVGRTLASAVGGTLVRREDINPPDPEIPIAELKRRYAAKFSETAQGPKANDRGWLEGQLSTSEFV
jgi:hypothetical protein